MKHAKLSPSSASRWMACPASVNRSWPPVAARDTSYADDGTLTHKLAADVLNGVSITCDAEREARIMQYVDYVSGEADGSEFMGVEWRLSLQPVTGEVGGYGTADAVIIRDGVLQVHDLKDGFTPVEVEDNPQLMIYALAAYYEVVAFATITKVETVIHQPKLSRVAGVCEYQVAELLIFGEQVTRAADAVWRGDDTARPGIQQCRWCDHKAYCPELATQATDEKNLALGIGDKIAKCDLIEVWIKSVRAEGMGILTAGGEVAGYKLVQGRRGSRAWRDEAEAEATAERWRLKKSLTHTEALKSPTQMEKSLDPKGWTKMVELVIQPEGKPVMVPVSDKREPLAVVGFEVEE